jgi:VWFA-related protein
MTVRHRANIGLLALVVFVFLATRPTSSQTPSSDASKQLPTIKVRTGLVLVPTIVTDRSGAHVPGLKQEDFAVLENGKPQQISFFVHVKTQAELMKRPAVPSGVTNTVEGTSQRLTIFMFDLMNSSITEQQTARDQFFKLLSKSLDVKA